MSHWVSIGDGLPFQWRDNHTGDLADEWEPEMQWSTLIDVAVSPGVQPNIRFTVWLCGYDVELQLTCTQAVQLRQMLQRAIDAIPEDDSAEDSPEP